MVQLEGSSRDPASRFPVELTTKVFGYVRSGSRSLKWLRITFVCRVWRQLALDSPLLWSDIHIGTRWTPEIVDAFLHRSKSVRLNVSVDEREHARDLASLFKQLAPQAYRFRSLSVQFDLRHQSVVQAHLSRLGSSVSTLQLTAFYHAAMNPGNLLKSQGLSICAGDLPALRELYLDGVLLDPRSSVLARLQKLSMRDIWHFERFGKHRCVDKYLYAVLSECVGLEDLYLHSVFHPEIPITAPAIYLPRLRTLRLLGEGDQVANHLSCFSVPTTTAIEVTSEWEIDDWFTWMRHRSPRVFSTALPRPATDNSAAFRHTNTRALRFRAGAYFEVQGYTGETTATWTGRVDLSSIQPPQRKLMLISSVLELKEIVKAPHILKLELHIALDLWGGMPWEWLLDTFPNLQELTIGGPYSVVQFAGTMSEANDHLKERMAKLTSLSFCMPTMNTEGLIGLEHAAKTIRWLMGTGSVLVRLLVEPPTDLVARQRLDIWRSTMASYGVRMDVCATRCNTCAVRAKPRTS
ncbi:hypothetical protein FKP32DRAFT_499586 [Trametes sanguinea]|nr:hypothetical protein FKP32DRAFT_499586 [Trametes sanguinea]